ncbi:MAG: acetylxylan esterase, partial [Chloroflexi bacterium]|nr:acetylxylan esterase [Chloroflexota bacterium]
MSTQTSQIIVINPTITIITTIPTHTTNHEHNKQTFRMDAMIADYKCSVSKPDDFDEFWGNVLDEAANIPLNPETVSLPL